MTTTTRDPGLTRAQLVKVIRTDTPMKGVAKMRALAALQARPPREVADVFGEVAADSNEAPRFRHMAVLGLYRMGGPRAREALTSAAKRADEATAPGLAMALGRVGGPESLDTIEALERLAARRARGRVAFAATLVAYRHRLDGRNVRSPAASALQELGRRRSRPVEIAKARADVARRALAALDEDPVDLNLVTDAALRIVCDPNDFVWVWSAEAAERGFAALSDRKGVAGVLFRKRRQASGYALSAFGLVTPGRAGTRVTIHRASSGTILYAGVVESGGTVALKARDHPGLAAITLRGRVEGGRVEVATAKSATVAREALGPKPSGPPAPL